MSMLTDEAEFTKLCVRHVRKVLGAWSEISEDECAQAMFTPPDPEIQRGLAIFWISLQQCLIKVPPRIITPGIVKQELLNALHSWSKSKLSDRAAVLLYYAHPDTTVFQPASSNGAGVMVLMKRGELEVTIREEE